MSLLLLLGAGEAVGPYIINGVDRLIEPGWEISRSAGNRAVFRCSLLSEDGSDRPALDEEAIVKFPSEHGGMGPMLLFASEYYSIEFAGFITGLEEAGIGDNVDLPIRISVNAADYHALAERRHVSESIPAGTLKQALQAIVDYLPGVTLDAAQVDGPSIAAQSWDDVQVKAVLDQLGALAGGYVWEITDEKTLRMFEPGTQLTPFDIDATTKTITAVRVTPQRDAYANRVIARTEHGRRAVAEDASAATNPWELIVSAPESTADPALQEIADAMLAISLVTLKRVQYRTLEQGLRPGQTQVINLPSRNLNNTFLLTDVVTRHHGGQTGGELIEHTITAVEGLVLRTGWRDTYKRWNSGSGSSVAGGGIGAAISKRFAYYLGGSGVEAVESATPTWVPVSGGATSGGGSVQVQLNTVARGTTAALIVARLRALAPSVSVKARLFDVTDGVACPGESALVTSTDWQTVTFSVTLTPGSHLYELEVLPGAADSPVFGVGYVE